MTDTHVQIAQARREVVAFRVANQDFCIDIGLVREIRGWTRPTMLPNAPPHIKGVINLRGAVVPVVDLARRLGLGDTDPTDRNVIVIVNLGRQTVGLLADVVSDILVPGEEQIRPVPELAGEVTRDLITNVITLDDGRILRKIDLGRILGGDTRSAAGVRMALSV